MSEQAQTNNVGDTVDGLLAELTVLCDGDQEAAQGMFRTIDKEAAKREIAKRYRELKRQQTAKTDRASNGAAALLAKQHNR